MTFPAHIFNHDLSISFPHSLYKAILKCWTWNVRKEDRFHLRTDALILRDSICAQLKASLRTTTIASLDKQKDVKISQLNNVT